MNQSQVIRDVITSLKPAKNFSFKRDPETGKKVPHMKAGITFSVPTDNPHSTRVLILRAARIAGIKVKTWHSSGMVFIVRVE